MRRFMRMFWLTLLVICGLFVYRNYDYLRVNFWPLVEQKIAQVTSQKDRTAESTNTAPVGTTEDDAVTPVESIVAETKLSNVYYYGFEDNAPASVRNVFEEAVAIYNETGLVELKSGTPADTENKITFGIYTNEEAANQNGLSELGRGGPNIIKYTGWTSYVVNRGSARLNLAGTNAVRLSVAIHELGHVLGLAHSTNRNSVMYPIDQGKTGLQDVDIRALQTIYAN